MSSRPWAQVNGRQNCSKGSLRILVDLEGDELDASPCDRFGQLKYCIGVWDKSPWGYRIGSELVKLWLGHGPKLFSIRGNRRGVRRSKGSTRSIHFLGYAQIKWIGLVQGDI